MLGAIFALLSAMSFALNNAIGPPRRHQRHADPGHGDQRSARHGLLSAASHGSPANSAGSRNSRPRPTAWMAGLGVLHFVIGRYFNFKANQVAGINLTAPVVQLQVVVTMVLAVLVLHEPCTLLQMIGGVVMLAGSLITQSQPPKTIAAGPATEPTPDRMTSPRCRLSSRSISPATFSLCSPPSPTARRRSWRASRWNTPGRRPASSAD